MRSRSPPRRPDLATPFHTDFGAGNPSAQVNLWIALTDVVGPEGLWVGGACDSDHAAAVRGAPALDANGARPVPLTVGEALLFGAHTRHGAPAHEVDVTRVSVDLRVLAASQPRGPQSWKARPLLSRR